MSEAGGPRDMSRGHLERTVGVAVANHVMAPFYSERMARLSRIDPIYIETYGTVLAERQQLRHKAWGMARAVTGLMLDPECLELPQNDDREAVDRLLSEGMFGGSLHYSMYEGIQTQAHFPLRLAHDISVAAKAHKVRGFRATNLHDVATILRRPDFRDMVDVAATTSNGVWGAYSTTYTMPFGRAGNYPPLDFLFDSAGTVSFSPQIEQFLRDSISHVNREGAPVIRSSAERNAASSGCPARRLKPSFLDTPQDSERLNLLANYFQTSPQELTKPLETNIITQGLDLTVAALDHVHHEIAQRTPLSSLIVARIGHAVGQRLLA